MKLKVATTMIMNIKHSFNKTRPQINVVTFCGISTDSERRVRSSNYGLFSNFDLRLNHKTIPRLLAELLWFSLKNELNGKAMLLSYVID